MDIPYPSHSRFLDACETAIRERHAELKAGGPVSVQMDEGGYSGSVITLINPANRKVFGTDWEGTDPTRFPARIKAAAAALLNCGCEGRFEIAYSSSILTIRAA